MFEELAGKFASFLAGRRPWYRLPKILGLPKLIDIRNKMRHDNLVDTEEPALQQNPAPEQVDPAVREARTIDGSYNDLAFPRMGAAGTRFGRNFPLQYTFPDQANLLVPNPRLVSRELMTRHQFQPATILNLLAAAWIQFMVHDWFVHKRGRVAEGKEIPLPPGDDWPGKRLSVPPTVVDPAPAGSTRPPAYVNENSHWWDASQVYGCDAATTMALRTGAGGKLKVGPDRRLLINPNTGMELTGFTENWWLGLALLHTLFTLEHNHICDVLAAEYPKWTDQQLFDKARLVNSALLAKIHTVEWTPAIVPHPTAAEALHINWRGVLGEDLQEVFKFLNNSEVLGGIVGSPTDHHAAPYSLTEEFVSVYRMHPLIPDEFTIRAIGGGVLGQYELPQISGRASRAVFEKHSLDDLFYSFGVSHPGAVRLHNYPRHLQLLERTDSFGDGEVLDLAAVDIYRDRERGVPRYNTFRRLLGKDPVHSFDELTDNPEWRQQLRRVYDNNLELVDLMTGLYAEPLPEGFGFSETAFRIFILMASRRLKSDRFFTSDFRPEVYSEVGYQYVRKNGLREILQRHVPGVAVAMEGVENPFAPWKQVVLGTS